MSVPKVEVVRSPDYRTICVDGVLGQTQGGYIEATIFSQETDNTEALSAPVLDVGRYSIRRTMQCRLVIDPITAKGIHTWLGTRSRSTRRSWERFHRQERNRARTIEQSHERDP